MKQEVIILLAEDDDGHAKLIEKNLRRTGIANKIIRFKDGQETLDFLFQSGSGAQREVGKSYLLILDIRMPKVDGVEVLQQVKAHKELKKIPVIMVTTTDDPREVERCHQLGCSNYVTKPVEYEKFIGAIQQIGMFLLVVQIPQINGYDK